MADDVIVNKTAAIERCLKCVLEEYQDGDTRLASDQYHSKR